MKQINKYTATVVIAALAAMVPVASQAAFISVKKVTSSASATLTGVGTVAMSASIKLISDNAADTAVNFPAITLPAGWTSASDYIAMTSTVTASNGGVQIYTDNTNASAVPKYTGNPANVDPSGLVDNTNTALRLPVAWSVKDAHLPVTTPPVATEPNNTATDPNAAQWIYIADKGTVAIPPNTAAFVNGGPNSEVVDGVLGLHAASGGSTNGFFAGTFATTNIYISSNFGSAVTPRVYSTGELIVEAFTQ